MNQEAAIETVRTKMREVQGIIDLLSEYDFADLNQEPCLEALEEAYNTLAAFEDEVLAYDPTKD